ncbi:MAG TPA: substrate-binding domain-containing protein [Candidatus Dormibacteraeota bacterium]|nr:substrate-binding domain-containing protein [Candidatus Dormibacteraeota bacterium]
MHAGETANVRARISYPQLTTVRPPQRQMGTRAAREAIKAITDGAQGRRIVMTPEACAESRDVS